MYSLRDDQSWKWTPERELNQFELQELGFNCERARMLLEETVNEEYCTYITTKYHNYELRFQLTLIWKSWKKIQNPGNHPASFLEKKSNEFFKKWFSGSNPASFMEKKF